MREQIIHALTKANITATVHHGHRDGSNTVFDVFVKQATRLSAIERVVKQIDDRAYVTRCGAWQASVILPDAQPLVVVEQHNHIHYHYHDNRTVNITFNVGLEELEHWAERIGGRVQRRGAVAYLMDHAGRCIHEAQVA